MRFPILDPEAVDATWQAEHAHIPGDVRGRRGPARPKAELARVALLRDLAGLRYTTIAEWTSMSATASHAAHRLHAGLLKREPAYAAGVARIVRAALNTLPGGARGGSV